MTSDRGPRQMPSLYAIARYWHDRGEPFQVDLSHPHCFGCGTTAEINYWTSENPDEVRPDFAEQLRAIDLMLEALTPTDRHPRYSRRIALVEKSVKSLRQELAGAGEAWDRRRWNKANLERAHLITRVFDGLDGPQNLAPLCGQCHRCQPNFDPGQEQEALDWVVAGGWIGLITQEMVQAEILMAAQALTGGGRS